MARRGEACSWALFWHGEAAAWLQNRVQKAMLDTDGWAWPGRGCFVVARRLLG